MHFFSSSFLQGSRPSRFLLPTLLSAFSLGICTAQTAVLTPIRIDASQPFVEPGSALYDLQFSQSAEGSVVGLNSRSLTRNGKPWLPVMGEFHYSRFPRSQWDEELTKMKAAGVDIVATYVIWIHHEEVEGQFDWSGERDLRAFAQLCAKHGLLLEPRIGPWAHAEVRNGGLPDWVLKQGPIRSNDPKYLAAAGRFYAEIGKQLQGMMWQDGGPVIAIQLENEYAARGAGAGEDHILTLKKMAIENGLQVPYYFVTGWDNAVVPAREVIPVYGGGYPDAPWDGSTKKLAPGEVYAFRFQSRVASNMGAMGGKGEVGANSVSTAQLPYLTAEIGGGIEDTYHRRPVIQPDDIGSMFPVMLGSGVNLYGSYMFHGGENPDGKLTTLEESQSTHYPNDLPIKSYDFQAPIGEYGQERASLGKMKIYQYFLNSYGSELAPMAVHAPERQPHDPADFSVPRAAVRTRGEQGYLFFNNYVRNYAMPARSLAQFEVRLPSSVLRIPNKPIDLPSGAYFIWPIHQQVGGVDLIYSTAQPFTRLQADGTEIFIYAAVRGIAAEFAFAARDLGAIQASGGTIHSEAGVTYVSGIKPGVDAWIELTAKQGQKTRLQLLSAEESENAWKVRLGGADRLLITHQDVVAGSDGAVRLHSRGDTHFAFALTPPLSQIPQASLPLTHNSLGTLSVRYAATAKERLLELEVKPIKQAGEAAPVKLAPPPSWRANGVAQAPAEGELSQAAEWTIALPKGALEGLSEAFLQIRYQGDVARLNDGERLLVDDFFNGLDWNVGLKRYFNGRTGTFRLSILPLRKDAPLYLETPQPVEFGASGQAVRLESIRLVPEYELVLGTAKK